MDTTSGGSGYEELWYTKKEIFIIVKEYLKEELNSKIKILEEKVSEQSGRSVRVPEDSRASFSMMFYKMRTKWQEARRTETPFFKNNEGWLSAQFSFAVPVTLQTTPGSEGGRPSHEFTSSSEKSKRRKTKSIRASFTSDELAYATQMRKSDAHVFFTSVVPLQLVCVDHESKEQITVWKNPRSSSPRFCRPLRLQFLREDTESTLNEVGVIEEQIKSLQSFESVIDGKLISVVYILVFTMIYGKVCNAVSSTTFAQRCYLCGATSKDFNAIDAVLQKKIDETNLRFGLSTLHAWIRCFEYCLHLSYKLGIDKWQARSTEEKQITGQRKRIIQEGFKSRLGLTIDRPKPGFGSSNDGNTARRFFDNLTVSAAITGVDEGVIKRFYIILQVILCGHEINSEKFKQYAIETARKIVELYPWYPMPNSVHKHSRSTHNSSCIVTNRPIIRRCSGSSKQRHQNISRRLLAKTMEYVFNRLLVTSDPYVSSIRKLPQKKLKSLSPEALAMLLAPTVTAAADQCCAGIGIKHGLTTETISVDYSDSDTNIDSD